MRISRRKSIRCNTTAYACNHSRSVRMWYRQITQSWHMRSRDSVRATRRSRRKVYFKVLTWLFQFNQIINHSGQIQRCLGFRQLRIPARRSLSKVRMPISTTLKTSSKKSKSKQSRRSKTSVRKQAWIWKLRWRSSSMASPIHLLLGVAQFLRGIYMESIMELLLRLWVRLWVSRLMKWMTRNRTWILIYQIHIRLTSLRRRTMEELARVTAGRLGWCCSRRERIRLDHLNTIPVKWRMCQTRMLDQVQTLSLMNRSNFDIQVRPKI